MTGKLRLGETLDSARAECITVASRESPGIGFLHTAAAHVDTFGELIGEIAPSVAYQHLVRPRLLERARRVGCGDPEIESSVRAALAEFQPAGVKVVLCTCSTIGGVAENRGPALGFGTIRVDRPMAELAVRTGRKIAIVAPLASLRPTSELLQTVAANTGKTVELVDAPCLDAWRHFEAGDETAFHHRIAAHIDALDRSLDVIVLAQASMAPAAQLVSPGAPPVLTSPRLGVEAAWHLFRARSGHAN